MYYRPLGAVFLYRKRLASGVLTSPVFSASEGTLLGARLRGLEEIAEGGVAVVGPRADARQVEQLAQSRPGFPLWLGGLRGGCRGRTRLGGLGRRAGGVNHRLHHLLTGLLLSLTSRTSDVHVVEAGHGDAVDAVPLEELLEIHPRHGDVGIHDAVTQRRRAGLAQTLQLFRLPRGELPPEASVVADLTTDDGLQRPIGALELALQLT